MDSATSLILKQKLQKISSNIDLIISSINKVERNCSDSLVINNEVNYKNGISNMKYSLENEKRKIDREIIEELNG